MPRLQRLHHQSDAILSCERCRQMDMISHKYLRVDINAKFYLIFVPPMRINRKVFIAGKKNIAVVIALDDMLTKPHRTKTWKT